ncbi:MAG: dTMP kinase [Elioraea sp.]|nr:dTMP kinase [Elioraea sp.]
MTERGLFVTLEGGEGAGKSTLLRSLVAALRAAGRDFVATREPGGTPEGEALRRMLLGAAPGSWEPMGETLLHYAARAQHVARVIRPALARGAIVLSDRFADSTMVYQGYGLGVACEAIAAIHRAVLGEFSPDLTVVLDVPVEVGLARVARHRAPDRYEADARAFHERVRQGFLAVAAANPGRCVVVDATQPEEEVRDSVLRLIADRLAIPLAAGLA